MVETARQRSRLRGGCFQANLTCIGGGRSPGQARYCCGAVGGPDDWMTLEVSSCSRGGVRVSRTETSVWDCWWKRKRLCSDTAVKNPSWVFQSCASAAFADVTGCRCSTGRNMIAVMYGNL